MKSTSVVIGAQKRRVYCRNDSCPGIEQDKSRQCWCVCGGSFFNKCSKCGEFRVVNKSCQTCKASAEKVENDPQSSKAPKMRVTTAAPRITGEHDETQHSDALPLVKLASGSKLSFDSQSEPEPSPFAPFVPKAAPDAPKTPIDHADRSLVWNQHRVHRLKNDWASGNFVEWDNVWNFDLDSEPCATCERLDGARQSVKCMGYCSKRFHFGTCLPETEVMPFGQSWFCSECCGKSPDNTMTRIMAMEKLTAFEIEHKKALRRAAEESKHRQWNPKSLVQWSDAN